jgi:hypothetical protein
MAIEHTNAPAHSVAQPPLERPLWWLQPLTVVAVLGGFSGYAFWSVVIAPIGYEFGNYLSPFYSPLIKLGFWPFSPAILIAGFPLLFRATCYYYRKAYYRSFFWDPPACAIGEIGSPKARSTYRGESRFPFFLLNFHRFFLYAALVVLAFLWVDAIRAFVFEGRFGIGLGSLIFLLNVLFLSGYTFSCHSLRHLVGGGVDCMSCSRVRYSIWQRLSSINHRHGMFAWLSLFSVVATDLYVRLLSAGVLTDLRFF